MSRWLVIRAREAKLLVKWHFELDADALIRLAYHAVPSDLVLAGLQQLFEIRVIANWAGYHDWLIATQLYSHLPSSPTHHVMKPVCVSFARGLHSPRRVLHKCNSVNIWEARGTSAHAPSVPSDPGPVQPSGSKIRHEDEKNPSAILMRIFQTWG